MKRTLIPGLLLFMVCLSLSAAVVERDPYEHFFELTFGDFTEELARAKSENKKGIMFFFEQKDCPFCHRMKTTVLNRSDVQAYFRKHFLLFSVDVEGDTEVVNFAGKTMKAKEFAVQERVRATPVFGFYDLNGKRVARYTGATSGVEEFMWLGEFVAGGLFTDKSFVGYKREKRKQQ